jgi:hypothetical protein
MSLIFVLNLGIQCLEHNITLDSSPDDHSWNLHSHANLISYDVMLYWSHEHYVEGAEQILPPLSTSMPSVLTGRLSVWFFVPIGYIGEFEIVDDHRSGKIVVNLTGRLNKCGVISPRFDVPINDIEKWTNNLLPSRQFGYVVAFKVH